MKRHIVLLAAVILLVAVNVNAQTYPPELAGEQTTFGPETVRLEVVEVIGCPYSHAEATGFYWLAEMVVFPHEAMVSLRGYYAPSGRQVGAAPVQQSVQIPWDADAGCYLHVGDDLRFYAITFDGVGFTVRTGFLQPQAHCCPWYEFEDRQCLWVMSVEDPIPFRESDDGRGVVVE
jgi:hypothetical protein